MAVETKQRRAHFVMPSHLIEEVDALVGPRKRSQFVQEAVEEKLRRQRLHMRLGEMAGSLADVDIPGWDTSEAAIEWVRALRRGDPVGVSRTTDD